VTLSSSSVQITESGTEASLGSGQANKGVGAASLKWGASVRRANSKRVWPIIHS
jgi:hypothetical protein